MAPDPWCPCGSGEAETAEHIISERCDSFGMPGANADFASTLPSLCAWLEENDLAVSHTHDDEEALQSCTTCKIKQVFGSRSNKSCGKTTTFIFHNSTTRCLSTTENRKSVLLKEISALVSSSKTSSCTNN